MAAGVERLDGGAVEWRVVDGEILVLDLRNSHYLSINRSGARLWPLLVAGATRASLAATLSDAYDLPSNEAARDVDRFLDWLGGRGLLLGDRGTDT